MSLNSPHFFRGMMKIPAHRESPGRFPLCPSSICPILKICSTAILPCGICIPSGSGVSHFSTALGRATIPTTLPETFYMLAGEISFLVGDEIKIARAGDFLMVPRNTRHAFRVDSETARFLNGYTPASLEAALVEFATSTTERVLPPKNASAIIKMTPELLSRYGMDMLPGPDPLRPEGAVLAA